MKQALAAMLVLMLARPVMGQLVADAIDEAVALSAPSSSDFAKTTRISIYSTTTLSPFTGVALQGVSASDSLSGWIRFDTGGTLSAWHPMYIVRSYTDSAFLAAFRGDGIRNADSFQIRFDVDSGEEVSIQMAGTFLNTSEEEYSEESSYQSLSDFVIIPPRLFSRADWNAEPFRGTPSPLNRPDYEEMTLHHTAGFSAVTLSEGLEQVRRIQDFHQNGRGWSDIGYHFLMDQEGRLYQGRPFLNPAVPFENGPPLVLGAHVGGNNTGNIGVSLMGCYHPPAGNDCADRMTEAAVDSLITTYAFLSERYSVDPDLLAGHRDFSSTSCPGDNNYIQLPNFRTLIAELLASGNAPLGTAALSAAVDSLGVVSLRWRFLADAGIEKFRILRMDGSGTAPLFEREGASDGDWVDATVQSPGPVTYLLVVEGGGGRIQTLSSAEIEVLPGHSFVLAQSFPNPASDQVTIRFHLERAGIVSLEVYDLSGRLVLSEPDAYRKKELWYVASLNTTSLSNGVYYYQIQVEGFADTIFKAAYPLVILR